MRIVSHILLLLLFISCTEDNININADPTNLTVEVLSVDFETLHAVIQASAENAIKYKFFIDDSKTPAMENSSGLFEYVFEEQTSYGIEVRAYGESGKYIKQNQQISFLNDTTHEGYKLIWSDEFNGNIVNTSYWTFETGTGYGGWGNNEWQYYKQENAWLDNGSLIIEARKENYSGSDYTSARIITKEKESFKYGRIDIRAILPEGQGIWPALWMLGDNISSAGWPKCGEIDIMEMIGGNNRENTTHGTLHWDNNGEHIYEGESYSLTSGIFADKFHVFSIIWDETSISWLVDEIQFYEHDITPDHMSEFHQKFFLIFNVAVGGNWPGYPNETTIFPQQMKVDYVRVFQSE